MRETTVSTFKVEIIGRHIGGGICFFEAELVIIIVMAICYIRE